MNVRGSSHHMLSGSTSHPFLSNSLAIRQEIQRFESVHPSIYAIYDLIEAIPDILIQQQIREHVVCIEDSFVNSQEWTLSRAIPDLKLGILGTINSGKSALVHRYLTGSYMQEESPEGGRFKKEVVLDGHSYLLLIRDEGGLPEMQFTQWVDAVVFVFSLENEASFNAIYSYYAKMAHYHANMSEVPVILVGTQDAISESNPRLIDDTRARKLASDLKRCSYYETCATYGLNVERVFQDACQKIVQQRLAAAAAAAVVQQAVRSSTPNHMIGSAASAATAAAGHRYTGALPPGHTGSGMAGGGGGGRAAYDNQSQSSSGSGSGPITPSSSAQYHHQHHHRGSSPPSFQHDGSSRESSGRSQGSGVRGQRSGAPPPPPPPHTHPSHTAALGLHEIDHRTSAAALQHHQMMSHDDLMRYRGAHHLSDQSQPSASPATFISDDSQKEEERSKSGSRNNNGEMGSGRVIPLKQGILYKKSSKPLSKEWKKKYVTLLDDGRLTYHPSLHDYMDNVRGKEIGLVRTTVKIPGQRPRGSEAQPRCGVQLQQQQSNGNSSTAASAAASLNSNTSGSELSKDGSTSDAVVISNTSLTSGFTNGCGTGGPAVGSQTPPATAVSSFKAAEPPSVKKRQKRGGGGKGGGSKGDAADDADAYEFMIVSLDNTVWHFDATSLKERDAWVTAIEQQILSSLQLNMSEKSKGRSGAVGDKAVGQTIRSVRGNNVCADCETPNPDWASLNLGVVICIECSGIHRNIGSHITRVRSLDLDDWPPELVFIMNSTGNQLANSIWEANVKGHTKPSQNSSREEKEKWIRAKYEQKEFLPPPPYMDVPLPQQLIDAVARQDIHNTILVLAYCRQEHVNTPYSRTDTRTALHIAAALGNLVLVQLLVWYGANCRAVDHEGHNALFYARGAGSMECAELLKAQGCPENPTLPRRRISNPPLQPGGGGTGPGPAGGAPGTSNEMFDKLPASVI